MIIPIITGPTSSGKSSTAFNAGLKTGKVEIISADAFQVYTGLDIGTAKVSQEERQLVKHHLIDIMKPDECFCLWRHHINHSKHTRVARKINDIIKFCVSQNSLIFFFKKIFRIERILR